METYFFGNIAIASVPFLGTVIAYFIKRTFDKVDHIDGKLGRIGQDVADIKPKVDILWRDRNKQ